MYVESFHNALKTYYMKRKTNNRVDDLINVLLTYEEDNYWQHKREKIYTTKHQSANNNSRYTRRIVTVDEELMVMNKTTRKVKSQSNGKNIHIFNCFRFHLIIAIVVIIVIIIITTTINSSILSILLVNNILQCSLCIKTSSY